MTETTMQELQCLIVIYSRWATRNKARWNQPIMKLLWVLCSMVLLQSAITKGILFFLSLYQRYPCAKTHSVKSSLSKLTELCYVYWSFDKMSYYLPDYISRLKSTKCPFQITCSYMFSSLESHGMVLTLTTPSKIISFPLFFPFSFSFLLFL